MNYPVQFFVENTNMDVRISNDGETITVRNSPVNTIFQENAEKVFEEGYDIDSLITKYPASPAAAFYLYRYFTYQLPLDELKATRAKISSELAGCPYVKDLDGIIKQLENVQIGKVAPEFRCQIRREYLFRFLISEVNMYCWISGHPGVLLVVARIRMW